MNLAFDGAVIVILILTALTGYYRGFVRYVVTMLGTVAAVVIAFSSQTLPQIMFTTITSKAALYQALKRRWTVRTLRR